MTIDSLPVQPASGRLLVVLVLDTSFSMEQNGGIGELNRALKSWRDDLNRNQSLSSIGEVAMVTFGYQGVKVVDPSGRSPDEPAEAFVPVRQFDPPELKAGGVTPMVDALERAFLLVQQRKERLRNEGRPLSNRPLVYLVTDGAPTDERGEETDRWRSLLPVLRSHEADRHLLFFAIGVRGADARVLSELAPRSNVLLADISFDQVLKIVSSSVEAAGSISRDLPADQAYGEVENKRRQMDDLRKWLES